MLGWRYRNVALAEQNCIWQQKDSIVARAKEMTPINTIDGKPLSDGKPGPITRILQSAYDDLVRGRNKKYLHWLTPVWPDDSREG